MDRRVDGQPSEGTAAEVLPGPALVVARLCVVAALVAGTLVTSGAGRLGALLTVVGVVTATGWAVRHPGVRASVLVYQATEIGCAVAGLALGSAGRADFAVAAAVPLAFAGFTTGGIPLASAATFGLIGESLGGRLGVGAVAAVAGTTAVGAWAMWVGGALAARVHAAADAEVELTDLRAKMITTVSHELRTPLTVIQAATATLARRWDALSEPERLDLVDVLTDNAASLDASILHFIDAARLEKGGVVLRPEWLAVESVVTAAIGRRRSALAGHDVKVELATPEVWADERALGAIIEHLLLNAARFSRMGLPVTVRTSEVAADGEVTITVSDRGQGIPPHLRLHVWEPLGRGDVGETGVSRGAGLGLPIVRELARLHGGEASLSSVKGRGTAVKVRLPQPPRAVETAVAG